MEGCFGAIREDSRYEDVLVADDRVERDGSNKFRWRVFLEKHTRDCDHIALGNKLQIVECKLG